MLSEHVDVAAHLMSDEWKSFVSIGQAFTAHDTVRHSDREYVRGSVHANSAEGYTLACVICVTWGTLKRITWRAWATPMPAKPTGS